MKKTIFLFLGLLFFISLLLIGCRSSSNSGNGLEGGACYWKNSIRYNLPTTLNSPKSESYKLKTNSALGINSLNSNVYIAGTNGGGVYYWNNGVYHYITDCDSFSGIFVEGTDVYIIGEYIDNNYGHHACYWKNGVRSVLEDGYTSGIFVKDSKVYVSGQVMGESGEYQACYWVDGKKHLLNGIGASGIFVEGSDIYLSGAFRINSDYIDTQGCYWKNDQRIELNNYCTSSIYVVNSIPFVSGYGGGTDQANKVFVSNNDVYIAGIYGYEVSSHYFQDAPCYWNNGELIPLDIKGRADDIFVSGSDVYVVGLASSLTGSEWPTDGFWVNGSFTELPGAEAIYVVNP